MKKTEILKYVIPSIVVVFLIFLDQLTKFIAESNLYLQGDIVIIPKILSFQLVYNSGAAFSLGDFSSVGVIFLLFISIVALPFLVYYLFISKKFKNNIVYRISLILILAGDFGNLIDRFIYVFNLRKYPDGYVPFDIHTFSETANNAGVVDFIKHPFFGAIYNLADAFLVVGVILLCVYILIIDEKIKNRSKKIMSDENSIREINDDNKL